MKKQYQLKKNHHYVWADYLRAWSPKNSDVWFSSKKGKVAYGSVNMVAKERHFYHVGDLGNDHIEIIKKLSSSSPLHRENMELLSDFIQMQIRRGKNQNKAFPLKDKEQINAFKYNAMEDLHAKYERGASTVLKSLREENLAILGEAEHAFNFYTYLGQQFARTKSFKDTSLLAMSKAGSVDENPTLRILSECWWFISHVIGCNLGFSLYMSRGDSHVSLLINDTQCPFITSDNPAVNVHPGLSDEASLTPPPEGYFDLYYPISPRIGFLFSSAGQVRSGVVRIDEEFSHSLNEKISKKAYQHIFGNSEASIKPYMRYVGKRYDDVKGLVGSTGT